MKRKQYPGLALLLALLPAPVMLEAQTRGAPASITPAPQPQTGRSMGGRGFGRGGGWFPWPWGGWSMREEKPLPKPFEPEPPARAWVQNKDYQPPRLHPSISGYADGVLPAPGREAPAPVERLAPCRLVLQGVVAPMDAAWCEWRDDSVRYEDDTGRVSRVSLDLVNWRESDRPGQR